MRLFSKIENSKDITDKEYVDALISGKANLSGGNTLTGTQTLNDPSSGGYSINAAGYIRGSWLQSSAISNKGANTGKVCVFDDAGWIYYRTPAEILTEAGGATTGQIPTVNNGTLTIKQNGTDVQTFSANQSTNVTANITVPTKVSEITNDSGFTTNKGTVTSVAVKMNGTTKGTVTSSGTIDLGTVITDVSGKLDKTTYEVNKTIEFGSSGVLYIGKFKVYDTNVTCEVTSTTNVTYSGKLVIATQNNVIQQMTVYGDAANTVAPNFFIKPSTTSDPYIEIYFKPASWSKNVVHIYGSAISAEPTNVCTSVSAVPSTATLKPTNALNSKANLNGGNTFTGPQLIKKATLHISGDSSFDNQYFLDIYDSNGAGDDLFAVYKTGTDAASVIIGNGVTEVELNVRESAGTDGQVLTSQGSGKTPAWKNTDAVKYTSQSLTSAQQTQARNNIGAGTVKQVKINGITSSPNSAGLVDLGTVNSAQVMRISVNNSEFMLFAANESGSFSGIFNTEVADGVLYTLRVGNQSYSIVPIAGRAAITYKLTVDVNRLANIMYSELTPLDGIVNETPKTNYSTLTSRAAVELLSNLDSSYVEDSTGVIISGVL